MSLKKYQTPDAKNMFESPGDYFVHYQSNLTYIPVYTEQNYPDLDIVTRINNRYGSQSG